MITNYINYAVASILIYILLVLALHLQFGLIGIANFGIASFFGLGAYTTAIITFSEIGGFRLPFPVGVLLAGIVSGIVGLLLGLIILRRNMSIIFIVTLSFGEVLRQLAKSEAWLTNGVIGIYPISYPINEYIYTFILFAIIFSVGIYLSKLKSSPYGRLLVSIRDNEKLACSISKDTFKIKLQTFTLGGILMGIAGSLCLPIRGIARPSLFLPELTFIVWISMIFGGKNSVLGSVVGTLIIVGIFNFFIMLLPLPSGVGEIYSMVRFMVFGLLLVIILRFRPDGLFERTSKVTLRGT